MLKLTLRIASGVDRSQAFVFARTLLNKVDDAPFRPKADFPVIFEWEDLQAIYKLTAAGNHSFTIRYK